MEITTDKRIVFKDLDEGRQKAFIRVRLYVDGEEISDKIVISGPREPVEQYWHGQITKDQLAERLGMELRQTA